jgi:hypothetical protein
MVLPNLEFGQGLSAIRITRLHHSLNQGGNTGKHVMPAFRATGETRPVLGAVILVNSLFGDGETMDQTRLKTHTEQPQTEARLML